MNLTVPNRIQGTLLTKVGTLALRVVYSDESESEPLVVITALVMNMDEHWQQIESTVDNIKRHTPKTLLFEGHELKGSVLYGAVRKVEWQRSTSQPVDPELDKARSVLFELLSVLIHHPTPIIYAAVDRAGWEKLEKALMELN
jgi:hypothetical protein